MVENRCRECKATTAAAAYLMVPKLRGGGRICISCADKLMFKGGHKDIRGFVTKYLTDAKPPTVMLLAKENAELKRRLAELERLLDR